MGSWGVKALESDNGLDLIFLLKTDYLPKQRLEIVGYENPCHAIVEALAKKLEELLAGRRIFRPANTGQLGS